MSGYFGTVFHIYYLTNFLVLIEGWLLSGYGGNYNGITYSQFLKSDTRTAAIAFERVYERCGDYSNEDSRRANNAEKAYNKFHK